jgi:hypothetical protein
VFPSFGAHETVNITVTRVLSVSRSKNGILALD